MIQIDYSMCCVTLDSNKIFLVFCDLSKCAWFNYVCSNLAVFMLNVSNIQ